MEILVHPKFRLVKHDLTIVRNHIIYGNEISDWKKIGILMNIFMFFEMAYVAFLMGNSHPFLFMFSIVLMRSLYAQFILNIWRIDNQVGLSLLKNTAQFFV